MTDDFSAGAEQRLSDCIGLIYDCALDTGAWPAALAAVAGLIDSANAGIGLHDMSAGGAQLLSVSVGVADAFLAAIPAYAADAVDLWSHIAADPHWPLDQPFVASRDVPPAKLAASRYVREWAAPQGVVDMAGLISIRQPTRLASFAFGGRATYSDAQIARVRLLAPHLRRAIVIGDLIEAYRFKAAAHAEALDRLAVGVLLTDRRGRVIHANAAAEALLKAERGLRVTRGQLETAAAPAQAEFDAALAAAGAAGLAGSAIGLAVSPPGEPPVLAYVLPLRTEGAATVAVFLQSADAPAASAEEAIARLYGLTPAETQVLARIGAGAAPAEAAQAMGLSEATIRTHLSRIFHKTGTAGQAELQRLLRSLSAPVRD